MKHTATITLTKKEYQHIKDALSNKERPEYGQLTHTAVFDNGMVMDVKCVASQDEDEGAWTEAVLFKPDAKGCLSEVAGTPAIDDYLGEWECTYKGDTYTVKVIVDKKELTMSQPFKEHFIVIKAPQTDIPFAGLKKTLYEIAYVNGGNKEDAEACSSEHIADELEIVGTQMARYHKVMKLITGNCECGVLYYNYYVDDRLFTDPYFLKESECQKIVDMLNIKYNNMLRKKAKNEAK